ncbi:hypothetical protein EV363DRAFT_1402396 [Boletus edulis]|nr:hypothetical protein EV363DRAFT_1402396 [Boletus edulis]
MKYIAAAVLAVTSFNSVSAQSSAWCGKNFMPNQTVVPPGGQFQLPASSNEPLVAFRCAPAFRPYLEEDAKDAAFIIDTPIIYQYIQGASLISLPSSGSECDDLGTMDVQLSIGHIFARQAVPLNSTGYEITVDISSLPAQKIGYNVSMQCYISSRNAIIAYPATDLRTGALWARPADGKGGDFQPFIPQGFYVPFDQYLAKNLSLIEQLKADGFNTIHPVPPYDNATLFEQLLNRTVELGLYLIYDMRSNYQNLTAVTQQVQAYSSLPNLLLWETAHEPDGSADPFGAARSTYDLIYEMDGYHPISIVLNCEDYNFAPYVEGADIVLEDAYPVGINATFSPSFKDRLNILGYDRTKTVWSTPSGIWQWSLLDTTPTGPQWAAMGLTSFSHGATALTVVIAETVQPFLVDPEVTHETFNVGGVDAGLWDNGTAYLLLVTSFDAADVYVAWADVGLGEVTDGTRQVQQIFSVGQTTNASGLNSCPGGIGVYVATPPE